MYKVVLILLILDKFFWKYDGGGDQIDTTPQKKLLSKSPALLGLKFMMELDISYCVIMKDILQFMTGLNIL